MLETLHSLPVELPLETRRATVKAMLSTLGKTMGATPETVVSDASRKLAALDSFAQFMEKKTTATISKNEEEIAALEAQIDAKRTAIQAAKTELAKVTNGCEAEADKLDDVLEFFSLDVGASKHAPPPAPTDLPVINP
jgi:DNA anti-recombination protein RmuC